MRKKPTHKIRPKIPTHAKQEAFEKDFFQELHDRVGAIIAKTGDTKRKFVSDEERLRFVELYQE